MSSLVDRDTFNWLFRLALCGAIFIALFSIFDNTPFVVRAIGDLFTCGALLFLVDIEGGQRFKRLYRMALYVWVVILIHAGIAFIAKQKEALEVFQTITYLVYALTLLSLPLFTQAMGELSAVAKAIDLERTWKKLTRFSATYYFIPFVAFVGSFAARVAGGEAHLFYGVEDTSNIPADLVKYVLRLLFLIPPSLVIITIHKTRKVMLSIAAQQVAGANGFAVGDGDQPQA